MAAIFNIKLGERDHLDTLLEKASEALTLRSMENLKEASALNDEAKALKAESEVLKSIADPRFLDGALQSTLLRCCSIPVSLRRLASTVGHLRCCSLTWIISSPSTTNSAIWSATAYCGTPLS